MRTKYKYTILTENNFRKEVIEYKKPVLVDFCNSWRGSVQIMTPTIIELATEFKGRVKVGRLDVDKFPQIQKDYGICIIPTFLIFKNSQVVDHVIGIVRKKDLIDKLSFVLK